MEKLEIQKRLEWLDEERQKDKQIISELLDQIAQLKDDLRKQENKIKGMESEVKKAVQSSIRNDQLDASFSQYKTDIQRQILDVSKKNSSAELKQEKLRKEDIDRINKRLTEFQTEVKTVSEIKKTFSARLEEEFRINQKVDETTKIISDLKNSNLELQRLVKTITDENQVESTRLSDFQVEVATLRKKIEEGRATSDVHKEGIKKLDSRLNEIQSQEQTRKQEQVAFIENLSLIQVEHENEWKEWRKRFEQIEVSDKDFRNQMLELENTHRAVKNAQKEFDEVNQRFDRRINEITEMNRLSDERFRQEWVSFKADDQKRWANYSLTSDEQKRETERQMSQVVERLIALEDLSQELKDAVSAINEETEKQIKNLMTLGGEFLDSYHQAVNKRT